MNALAARWAQWPGLQVARDAWKRLAARERWMVAAMALVVGAFLLWSLAIAPAWRQTQSAPAEIEALEQELQQMRRLAAEVRDLRGAAPVGAAQAGLSLKAATDRLGPSARLALQPDRAVLTLQGVSGEQLRAWLAEARSGARARPVEAQITRGAQGYSGTVVVALGGAT